MAIGRIQTGVCDCGGTIVELRTGVRTFGSKAVFGPSVLYRHVCKLCGQTFIVPPNSSRDRLVLIPLTKKVRRINGAKIIATPTLVKES